MYCNYLRNKKSVQSTSRTNTGLLLLTAKIGKELQQLRKETSEIQQNASELIKKQVEAQISVQTGKENCGSKRKSKLPLALTVSVKLSIVMDYYIIYAMVGKYCIIIMNMLYII